MYKITLKKNNNREPFEPKSRYSVLLNGDIVGELYFNMTGYIGCCLPQPDGIPLDCGEQSLAAWRRDIAHANREARTSVPLT